MKNLKCKVLALCMGASIFMCGKTFSQVPSYVPTNGLVGWWPFNGNANDESGNGNNGTNNGATLTTDRNGVANKAYGFDGVSNSIDCGPLSSISNPVSDITQSAWILAPIDQTSFCKMAIMSKRQVISDSWPTIGGGANGGQGFPINNQAYFFLNAPNYGSGYQNALSSASLSNDGNWHLITGTKSGSTYKLYFDGILQATLSDSYSLSSNSNLIIGHEAMWGFDCERWFAGKLDDIGIWNRALTQEEITNLYYGCSASTITSQPSNQAVNPTTSAQFIVNATSGSSFQWQTDLGFGFQNLSNAGQYSGANNDTLVVSNASTSNNNQQFRCIVNPAGCADTSNIAVLTVSTVGMDELSVQGNVSLYPNPTQSSFEIQTSLVYSKIEIRDMQGRIVKTENAAKTINLSSLQKGTYSVNLLDEKENTLAVRKIVLQ